MHPNKSAALLLSFTFFVASGSLAQMATSRGAGPRPGGRMYDPKTVETLSGQVVSVQRVAGKGRGRGGAVGLHLVLKTPNEEISVHLGPDWYMKEHGWKVAPHDMIEVRGSRVTLQGKPAIVAAEIKQGEQSLKLRNDQGAPVWSGRGPS